MKLCKNRIGLILAILSFLTVASSLFSADFGQSMWRNKTVGRYVIDPTLKFGENTMNPWLWFWAPQLHFPFSGAVNQAIEPDTSWFFNAIHQSAGNAKVEKRAVEVASYGRQLGLLTEVLLGLAKKAGPLSLEVQTSLERLQAIRDQIQNIKDDEAAKFESCVETWLQQLKAGDGVNYDQTRQRLLTVLSSEGT